MAGGATGARRRLPAVPELGFGPVVGLSVLAIAALLGWVIATTPEMYRAVLALGLTAVFGFAALRWANQTIFAVFMFLPVLGLVRRLLIESTGWPDADPLLLVGPAITLVLFAKAFLLDSRPLATDLLSKLVLAFLGLVILGVVNPFGAGLTAGAAALMLTGLPLLWFFIGRALPDRRTIQYVQYGTAILATIISVYGLYQTEFGFPSWDLAWIEVGGYLALGVGDTTRGFGTFASAGEYADFLAVTIVFAFAALLDRRSWPVVVLPLAGVALFLSSVRGSFLLSVLAIMVMLGLRSSRPRVALPAVIAGGLALYLLAAPLLENLGAGSNNDLVTHQLEGISQPFDEDSSTLNTYISLAGSGFADGVRYPLGQGVAPGNISTGDLNYTGGGTETDVSNAFVSFGLPGGLLFMAIWLGTLFLMARRYLESRDHLVLAVVGLGIVTLGSWLTGGNYALLPLLWFMLGWATLPRGRNADTKQAVSD